MLDFDLAMLYEVETRALNQAVKRNIDIFPEDFMFQLTSKEWKNMSSQIVMTYSAKRPKTALPLAFTEHCNNARQCFEKQKSKANEYRHCAGVYCFEAVRPNL